MTIPEPVLQLRATPSLKQPYLQRRPGNTWGWGGGLASLGKLGTGLGLPLVDTDSRNSSRSLRPGDREKALSRNWQKHHKAVLQPSVELWPGAGLVTWPASCRPGPSRAGPHGPSRPPPAPPPHPARQPWALVTGMSSGCSVTYPFGEVLNCNPANMSDVPFLNPRYGKEMQIKVSRRCSDWLQCSSDVFFRRLLLTIALKTPASAATSGPGSPAKCFRSSLSGRLSLGQRGPRGKASDQCSQPTPQPGNPPLTKVCWCHTELCPTPQRALPGPERLVIEAKEIRASGLAHMSPRGNGAHPGTSKPGDLG